MVGLTMRDDTAGDSARAVDRAVAGDRQAFGELLRRHDARLRSLAFKMLGGDRSRMDDVMQDAYLRAFRSLKTFRREADVGTWLHRIVHNACVDELRRVSRQARPFDLEQPSWDRPSERPGPERVVGAADTVLRILQSLPEDQRATVLLVDGQGFDNITAAEILGVAPGTVASRLSRARAALRTLLEEEAR